MWSWFWVGGLLWNFVGLDWAQWVLLCLRQSKFRALGPWS
ncbi:uncharacterized protein J3R85_001656 [Psidium guajava]|nr:uncharacterized protein J3R85_001656 [Psidium guajava]